MNEKEYPEPYATHLGTRMNQQWFIDQARPRNEGKLVILPKKYIRFTEARKDNILKYEEAMDTVGIVMACLDLKASVTVAYGYTFGFDNDEELEDRHKEKLKFLRLWSRFVNLTSLKEKIALCVEGLGDAFVEKIYDEKSYDEGGWGIKKLKLVHPHTVEIERDKWGNPKTYVQDVSKIEHVQGSYFVPRAGVTKGKSNKKDRDEWLIKVPAENVVHFKRRDYTGGAYGRSLMRPIRTSINILLGAESDTADIIRTMARPLTVWYMGDADNPMPRKHMEGIATSISQGLSMGSDIAVDGRVKAEVISGGDKVMDTDWFMEYQIRAISTTLGVPATILGLVPSTSGQTDEITEEYFRRRIMVLQNYIGGMITNEVLRDIFLFHPNDLKTANGRKAVHEITPIQYAEVPFIRYNEIENIPNRRLRVREELIAGTLTLPEARKEFGRSEYYDEDELHPQLRQFLAQAENLNKATENMDRELDIQEKGLEVQKETAQISAAAAKTRATNTKTQSHKSDKTKPK